MNVVILLLCKLEREMGEILLQFGHKRRQATILVHAWPLIKDQIGRYLIFKGQKMIALILYFALSGTTEVVRKGKV